MSTHDEMRETICAAAKVADSGARVEFGPRSESRDNLVAGGTMWDQPIRYANISDEHRDQADQNILALHDDAKLIGIREGYGRWRFVVWYRTDE